MIFWNWLCKLFHQLISPDNVAKLFITILGVFLGYLLSIKQYKKHKIQEENQLTLKYIGLLKHELRMNQSVVDTSLGVLNEKYDTPAIAINNFLKSSVLINSSISDEALPAVSRVGIIKILSLSKIIHSYIQQRIFCYQISNESQILRAGIERPGIDVPPEDSLYEMINDFKSMMKAQIKTYKEAVKELEVLEESLLKAKKNKGSKQK
ncbi:MAG TPA: hypothetical protein DDW50_20915 [Firmicutes bacterium]|jgi:hypothetical protein|nr:hypothetical protein [Bacillota bacterium]